MIALDVLFSLKPLNYIVNIQDVHCNVTAVEFRLLKYEKNEF